MTCALDIREWLRAQKRPCTIEAIEIARAADPDVLVGASPAEIAVGLGIPVAPEGLRERMRLYWSLGQMYKDRICGREGIGRGLRYFVLREPSKPLMTAEEKREKHNARARARYVPKKRDFAHMAMVRKAKADERKAERDKAKAEHKAQKIAAREAKRVVEKVRKPVKVAKPVRVRPMPRMRPEPAPRPALQRMESVEDYKARGGVVERLPTSWESTEQAAA